MTRMRGLIAARRARVSPPAPVDGTEGLNLRNAARLLWLGLRDSVGLRLALALQVIVLSLLWALFAVVAWHATPAVAVLVGVLAGTLHIALLLLFVFWTPGRRKVGYFTPDATLMVITVGDTWRVSDHHATIRNENRARPFRQRMFAELIRQADGQGVTIMLDTSVAKLRDEYLENLPGLEQVGQTTKRGRPLYLLARKPRSPLH